MGHDTARGLVGHVDTEGLMEYKNGGCPLLWLKSELLLIERWFGVGFSDYRYWGGLLAGS